MSDKKSAPCLPFICFAVLGLIFSRAISLVPAAAPATSQAAGTAVAFDSFGGYFVSNKFEPDKANSFVVLHNQKEFDEVFGVAFVMGYTSHRLAADAFDSKIILAAIKRGPSMWVYKAHEASVADGILTLRYTTSETKEASGQFACPLIVTVPKGNYSIITLEENGKPVASIHPN